MVGSSVDSYIETIYLNGVQQTTATGTGNMPNYNTLTMGCSCDLMRGFHGYLSDIRLYTSELTSIQVCRGSLWERAELLMELMHHWSHSLRPLHAHRHPHVLRRRAVFCGGGFHCVPDLRRREVRRRQHYKLLQLRCKHVQPSRSRRLHCLPR